MLVLFGLALGLRLCRLSNQSLWMDEISSVATARVPMNEIVDRSAQNNSLPTYFLLLRPLVTGSNEHIEIRARLISALAGAASIPVFIALVFLWRGGGLTALIAGLLLALNPLHLWYSQEARGYALMLLFGLCCLLSFELARSKGRVRWWIGYVLFAVAATAIHKTGLVFPVFCAVLDLSRLIRKKLCLEAMAPHLTLLAVASLILIEPSQPPAPEYGRPSSILEILYTVMTFVGGYSFGPSLTEIQNEGAKIAVMHHLVQIGILTAALLIVALLFVRRWRLFFESREVLLVLLAIAIVFLGALVSKFPYNVRYALPALFGFLALVAAFPGQNPNSVLPRIALTSVLVINVWADCQWFSVPNYRKGDSRAVARWLVDNRDKVKSWTVLPDYLGYSVKWYLEGNPQVLAAYLPPKAPQTTSFPPTPDVLIIGRRHHLTDVEGVIKGFQASAGQVRAINSIAGFELYVREAPAGPR